MMKPIKTDQKSGIPWYQELYHASSIALVLPVLCWPLVPYLGYDPVWGTSFERNWLVAAALLLFLFTVTDLLLSEKEGMQHVVIGMASVSFTTGIIVYSLGHLAQAWLIAATLALRCMLMMPVLWQGKQVQWWHWSAWWRDFTASLGMFIALIYW